MQLFDETEPEPKSEYVSLTGEESEPDIGLDSVINLDSILKSEDDMHKATIEMLGLDLTCGCGSEDCEIELNPTYSRLRIATVLTEIVTKKTGSEKCYDKLIADLQKVGSEELAAMLLYALSRSNRIEAFKNKNQD